MLKCGCVCALIGGLGEGGDGECLNVVVYVGEGGTALIGGGGGGAESA